MAAGDRTGAASTAEEDVGTQGRKPPKKGARASIQVEDIPLGEDAATDVLASASGRRRGGAGGAAGDPALQKFSRAIRNPVNKIIAARLQPQTMNDGTPLGDTLELPCHETQSIEEIKRDIQEARGGRKWIIRVYDEDEKVIASRSENINGMPRLDPMLENLDPQEEDTMQTGPELSEEELLEERLAKDPDIVKALKEERLDEIKLRRIQRQGELAEAEGRLKKARGEDDAHRTNGNGRKHDKDEDGDDRIAKILEAQLAPMREANKALQAQLDAANAKNAEKENREERRRELESATNPLKAQNDALTKQVEALVQKLNTPPPPAGPTTAEIMAKLESMRNEIMRDTSQQITNAINQATTAFNAKVDGLNNTINLLGSKGAKDPATLALITLATKSAAGGGAVDPFSPMLKGLEVMTRMKAMTGETGSSGPADFPSYLVEKMAEMTPEVLNFFKERGSLPTKEEVNAQMKAAAMKMYENLDASMKQALEQGFQRLRGGGQAIPAAAPAPAPAPAPAAPAGPDVTVQASAPAAAPSVVAFPGSAPAGSAPAPGAAPAPAPTEGTPTPAALFASLDAKDRAEYSKRITWVLGGMLREMELGVNEMQWPKQAHGNLPRRIIEQIVEATSDKDIYEIVKPYADTGVLAKIWTYLSPTNRQHEWYQEWLASGINWIKQAEGLELEEPTGEEPVVDD